MLWTWTPPIVALLILATLATVALKPRATLKLLGGVMLGAAILSVSLAISGWLAWEAILYLIRSSR